MKNPLLSLLLLFISLPLFSRTPIKVACVGNSVTFGYKLPDRKTQAYPVRLQQMLGNGYDVRNFGHSGATLLNKGHNPYMQLPEFKDALAFKPDMVVIHLGLNDTDPRDWPQHGDDFVSDVCLPAITRTCGKDMVPIALFHGMLIDMSVPLLVPFLCEL